MHQRFRFSFIVTVVCFATLCVAIFTSSHAQVSGVQPTPVPGSNYLYFDPGSNSYWFYHNGVVRYQYSILDSVTPNGGTFNVLRAASDNGSFLPSNMGGISAMFNGVEKCPWDAGVSFRCLNHEILPGDTLLVYWVMIANGDSCRYTYKLKIVGRTLVIRVEVDSLDVNSNKATAVELEHCEQASNPKAIVIPYLSMFSVLFTNDLFVSFFADWEITNASILSPHKPREISSSSADYAHRISYNPKTNGKRNRVQETLYLTTATNLEDVLPNIPNLPSPMKDVSANHIVWDYRQPFARLTRPPWRHMDSVWSAGVSNIWLQVHDWQHDHDNQWPYLKGYDDGLPCVLPANDNDVPNAEYGGATVLNSIISKAQNVFGYRIGLHQNYMDYYFDADNCSGDSSEIARNFDGSVVKAWFNEWVNGNDTDGIGEQSYLLRPSRAASYASIWSSLIQASHKINGSYLDVHSAVNPSDRIDYDSSVANAGKFRETLQRYRELFPILRQNHGGPVQGEGNFHFLHIGYADDIEARLNIPQNQLMGVRYPLLVDFDLRKLHSKTMVHGVGTYWSFDSLSLPAGRDTVLTYIATELAYGHGGYLPDVDATLDIAQHAQLEYKHVFSVQKDIANASPVQILYNHNGQMVSASQYIRDHPETYKDITNDDFMGQVQVTYSNGVVVYVNRHPNPTYFWTVSAGVPGGWFNYHADDALNTGTRSNTTFVLPPINGWVVYDPLKTPVTFANKIGSSDAGGQLLLNGAERISSGDQRYLSIGSDHEVKTMDERLTADSICKHHDWNGAATDFRMSTDFLVDQNHVQNAQFTGLKPARIQASLLEGGNAGGSIQIRDPWYVHSDGRQPDSLFTWTSPHFPRGAYDKDTGGVFLGQPIVSGRPYYSVGAPDSQPIGGREAYFVKWGGDTSEVAYQNPTALQTGIVFKRTGATATAMYKGHLASNQYNATSVSSQRKLVTLPSGTVFLVYSSNDSIWFSRKEGEIWSREKLISNGTSAKNPSIAYSYVSPNVYLHVVWEDDTVPFGIRAVFYSRSSNQGATWSSPLQLDLVSPAGSELAPAVAGSPEGATIVWPCYTLGASGLYAKAIHTDGTIGPSRFLRNTSSASQWPALDAYLGIKIAYRQGATIVFDEFSFTQDDQLYYPTSEPVTLSGLSGVSNNGVPSIVAATEHPLSYTPHVLVAWDADVSGSRKVVVRERVAYTSTWNDAAFLTPTGSTLLSVGTSFDEKTLKFILVWQADYHIDKTSRPITGGSWRTPQNIGTGTYPSLSNYVYQMAPVTAVWTLGADAYYEIHPAIVGSPHLASFANNATLTGSQRKLVRDEQSGWFYFTYESDGDILLTRSTDGANWEAERCVSIGQADCSAPSIAEKKGIVYVVWQRGTQSPYDIMYAVGDDGGTSWHLPVMLEPAVESPNYPPNPVIATLPDGSQTMVVFRGNGRLWSAYTPVEIPEVRDQWQIKEIPETHEGSRDQSLVAAIESYLPFRLVWSDGSQVYHQYYTDSWSSPTVINSELAGYVYDNYSTSIALSEEFLTHIAWSGLRPPWYEIIHNFDLNPSVFTEFVYPYYNHFSSPSVTGRGSDGAVLMWQGPSNNAYKAFYAGGYWSSMEHFGGLVAPSLSVSNPPGAFAHFVSCSPSGPPYSFAFGTEEAWQMTPQSKDNSLALRPDARRIVISSKNKDEWISFEIESPVLENAADSLLSFVPVIDTVRYDAQTVWPLLETATFNIRNNDLPLRIKHSVRGWRSRANQNPILNIPAVLEIVHVGTNNVLGQQVIEPVMSDSGTTIHGIGRLRPPLTGATPVKFRLRLSRTFPHQKFSAAVLNVFRIDTASGSTSKLSIAGETKRIPTVFALRQNYPNPFNPTTHINFDLPEISHVTLTIYDILGRRVVELVNGQIEEGYHSATWNAINVASGVYFARVAASDANGNVRLNKVIKLLLAK